MAIQYHQPTHRFHTNWSGIFLSRTKSWMQSYDEPLMIRSATGITSLSLMGRNKEVSSNWRNSNRSSNLRIPMTTVMNGLNLLSMTFNCLEMRIWNLMGWKMKQPTPMELIGRMEANWCQYGTFCKRWLLFRQSRPKPPKMAYVQKIDGKERQFSADKVLHVSKFKQGRSYGPSSRFRYWM